MEHLLEVVVQLSRVRKLEDVTEVVRRTARDLIGADGATFVLRDGDMCHYVEENAIGPLWKGMRFPMSACVSGWVMLHGVPAVIGDVGTDSRIPQGAYRPTFVKSLVMVPVRREAPVAAIGNYWAAPHLPSEEDIAILQALADTTAVALENAQLYTELQAKVASLAERERRIKDQHDALAVFTRALAHDLREPVRTICSFTGLLLKDGPSARPDGELLQHIGDAGTRMEMLIDTVYAYTRLDEQKGIAKSPVPLDAALASAVANLAQRIQERAAIVTCDPLPTVDGNPAQIAEVFQNLIANAIGHGQKAIRIHVGLRVVDGVTQVFVRDNGPGIPPEYRQAVFEHFKRLRHDDAHSGMGLAICRKIVELHGGRIACEPAIGGGTLFHFTVAGLAPLPAPAPVGPPATVAGEPGRLARVLVVDDSPADILWTRRVLLGPDGVQCDCVVAHDGREGMAMLENLRGVAPIDVVLLDINMPGMDGFAMLEAMRLDPAHRDIPVVMHSGSTYEVDIARARQLGAAGYLVKPARPSDLLDMLGPLPNLQVCRQSGKACLLACRRATARA